MGMVFFAPDMQKWKQKWKQWFDFLRLPGKVFSSSGQEEQENQPGLNSITPYFLAIEVKNSAGINNKMLKGLNAFLKDYPEARGLLLYRGNERLLIDNILCLPCEQFLKNLVAGQELIPESMC